MYGVPLNVLLGIEIGTVIPIITDVDSQYCGDDHHLLLLLLFQLPDRHDGVG